MHQIFGKPLGPRVLVEYEEVLDSVSARAKAANLHVVIADKNKPRPTVGRIVARGDDPILDELGLQLGVRVTFGTLAGSKQYIKGKEYRILEAQEVVMILPPQDAA